MLENIKDDEINQIQKFINEEFDRVSKLDNIEEQMKRFDILKNIFMITQNYDELEPILSKFFDEKHQHDKWENER